MQGTQAEQRNTKRSLGVVQRALAHSALQPLVLVDRMRVKPRGHAADPPLVRRDELHT